MKNEKHFPEKMILLLISRSCFQMQPLNAWDNFLYPKKKFLQFLMGTQKIKTKDKPSTCLIWDGNIAVRIHAISAL